MKSTAGRMSHLAAHFFAALSARLQVLQAEGRDIIRMDEGAPDLPPAPHILEALQRSAARPDAHSYQTHRGPRSLRQAWAGMYRRLYAIELDPEQEITPLLGSKEGIFHLSLAYIEPGDVALVPDPGYITYTRGALIAGGEVFPMPLLPERGYLPDLEALPRPVLQRAKLMWLNYPNNPTAAVANLDFFNQAVELAREYGFLLCHDAAYMQVAFDGEQPPSLLQAPGAKEVAVEFNTLSKSHNMAGWRTGALLGNPQVVRTLFTLKTNADSSHFGPIFEATKAALSGDQSWLEERNQVYRQRRDAVLGGLKQIGLQPRTPQASLYVWTPAPSGWDCEQFAVAALEQAGVSLTPGTVFGEGGKGFLRISITAPLERIQEAMERLKKWLG
jgi:LL-diaminopimelate aminotransferase